MAQVLIQVLTRPRYYKSLRDAIKADENLEEYNLEVGQQQKPYRNPGWLTLHNTAGECGAMKIEWDPKSRMLISRVVTRGKGIPNCIISDFIKYLYGKHSRKIEAITIFPR